MSSPTGEGAQSGATGAPSGTGTGTDAGAQGSDSTGQGTGQAQSGNDSGQGQQSSTETVSRADFEALKRQLQAADQNRSKVETELKAMKDAALTEEQRTKQSLEEATRTIAKLQEEIKEQKIQNAFVTDNTYTWHDPRAALRLADLSAVQIKEDGTVTGLKDALKGVADANPWMLKPKDGNGGTGATDDKGKPQGTTGVSGAAGRSGTGAQSDLEKRFPQLRGRVTG